MNEHSSGTRAEVPPSATDSGTPLRPCPLCKGKAFGEEHPPHKHVFATFMPDHHGSYTVDCPRCNLGLIADTEAEAKAAWNSRVRDDEAEVGKAFLEALRKHDPDYCWNYCPSEWVVDQLNKSETGTDSTRSGDRINPDGPDQGSVRNATILEISGAESIEEALDIFRREREANVGLATENEGLRTLLREWLDTELDPEDEEYAPWMEQFTKRVIRALPVLEAAKD